jgi:hypothetical protein
MAIAAEICGAIKQAYLHGYDDGKRCVNGWVNDRLPTSEDADEDNNVLIAYWDLDGTFKPYKTDWINVQDINRRVLWHSIRLPDPPRKEPPNVHKEV